ncbi:SMP-30/gluconolactonase/LRE family protein [Caballeronia sp. LP006]|uniref:SMP-30/gluconolactonase/LRE family protein n=1 Tax=Caballeronia sp. LP006 TaxID=3038552 RepID=UPI00285B42A4|nr:SMP-30/gluconolactonase/LRE family protein [Caballeronia sp. LP006]MDR5832327.1 SMP-30/gluconolactonase/LRE family protein [Caballeronia sp. LP006]
MDYPLPRDFRVDFDDLRVVTRGLKRPECVLALSNGDLIVANGNGGYTVVSATGGTQDVIISDQRLRKFLPNGIALSISGDVLFADLGSELGGIFSVNALGVAQPLIESLNGEPLPPSNYLVNDRAGRLWFTISTRQRPRTVAWTHQVADGYIAVADETGVRVVADGLGYTNEIAFSPDGKWLYVNETYNQRTSRFPLHDDATVGPKEVLATYDNADFPDGLTFDAFGGAWVTCIGSNTLYVIRPDGQIQTVLQDRDDDYARELQEKFILGSLTQHDMSSAGNSRLGNISSLAFGGPSLKTAYLGCLLDDCVRAFESPVPGLTPVHWNRTLKRQHSVS